MTELWLSGLEFSDFGDSGFRIRIWGLGTLHNPA